MRCTNNSYCFRLKSYLWDIYSSIMATDTVKRFDRIVAILIQLQSKKIVKAQELADRFQVSLRTIYRDIRTLEASGVPIYSEAGMGYSIMDGYRLPPVMFTREEAGSFVAAEKLMQKFTDRTLGAYHQSAMYKIKSVLRGKEKDWISALESQVFIDARETLFNEEIPDALEILFESIAEKKQVFLFYQSIEATAPIERNIEAVGVFHENHAWYIYGYCHVRKAYRQFRTDRIVKIKRTLLPFTLEHGNLEDYRSEQREHPKTKVRILVDRKVAKYIQSGKKMHGFVEEKMKGEQVEMTFMCRNVQFDFVRWFIMFADFATILEPESLKDSVRAITQRTLERLS